MTQARTGLSVAPARRPAAMPSRIAARISSEVRRSTGAKITISASTSSEASAISMVRRYASGPADATMSTGLVTVASAGRKARSVSRVASENSETARPAASQASTARMPGPPALVTIATRRPAGSGCASRHAATSNISSIVSARITPDCWNSALTATSLAASAAVWLPAARDPARVRPAFTATIGLVRAIRRAMRPNRRGLPNDSRYSRMTRVAGSSSQYLKQIVAGHVGLVADADERRQADTPLPGELEDGEAERAALRGEGDAAGQAA